MQDSWRITPTLTLNGGVRWDVQMPFTPVNDIMSRSTLADACGISGIGADGDCRLLRAERDRRQGARRSSQFSTGTLGYNTDWNNFAPNIGVAWRPNVQSGLLRDAPRRSGAGDAPRRLLGRLRPSGHGRLHRPVRRESRQHAQPDAQRATTACSSRPGETWPVLLRERDRLLPRAPFRRRARRRYPIALPRRIAPDSIEHLPSGHPGRVARGRGR